MQNWPVLNTNPLTAVSIAASRSASAKMRLALLPPSSTVDVLELSRRRSAAIVRPTAVDPVNAILSTRGSADQRLAQPRRRR